MQRSAAVLALAGIMMLTNHALSDGVPRLGCIYYGQIRNSYGRPCGSSDGVSLTLYRLGNQLTWTDITRVIGPGVNYQLQINAVAPGETPPAGTAVEGETVQLAAMQGGAPANIIGNTNLLVEAGGKCILRNFVLGTDADADGLPDEWELFMIAAIGSPAVTNIAQIDPNDDYDGDGASNQAEFYAGTFAFLASDVLRIEEFALLTNGVLRATFLSTSGLIYSIKASDNVAAGAWTVTAISSTAQTPPADINIAGNGDFKTVYFLTNGCPQFFRLFGK